jgi:anaphase-promoting complex subunit 3
VLIVTTLVLKLTSQARRAFQRLREFEPYQLENMEMFSTSLWHLNDALELSNLAQDLLAVNREAPQPWMVAGNCLSLQGEHDEAMRCFRRAAQLDPECAYAWTLCGHEATEMEEYDRAIAFFRTAIRCDSRHFPAWYGMGLVYLRKGKNLHAEHHFRRAAEINPSNPALLCCIGNVMEKVDNYPGALAIYEQACQYDDNSMARFNRSRVLVALGRVPVS